MFSRVKPRCSAVVRIRGWMMSILRVKVLAVAALWSSSTIARADAPVIFAPRDLCVLNSGETFHPTTNVWSSTASMNTARYAFGAAAIGNVIYAAGGVDTGFTCSYLNSFEAYDTTTNAWTTLAPMPTGRDVGMGVAAVDGLVYVIGGGTGCGIYTDVVEAFDPTSGWTTKAPMSTVRYHPTAIALHDSILNRDILYAIGGEASALLDSVEAFDPVVGVWTAKAHMNVARVNAAAAVANGKIYVLGGQSNTATGREYSVEEYDPVTNTWTLKNATVPVTAVYAAATLNGKIYLIGGTSPANENAVSSAYIYDPQADSFTAAVPMLTPRQNLAAVAVNGRIYAMGGFRYNMHVGQTFIYQIAATNHPTSYGASNLPPGLTVDTATGIVSGVPTTAGSYQPTFTATNDDGSDSKTIGFQVRPAPPPGLQLISSTCATGRVGQPFTFHVLADNASTSAVFTAGNLPDGLSIDATSGVISGTVNSETSVIVALGVTDNGVTDNGVLQLTFTADSGAPIITSSDFALLIPGHAFSYTVTADAAGNFGYIGTDGQVNGALPPNLAFDSATHTISGTYVGENFSLRGRPHTITIRPPLICQLIASNSSGTGTAPLNLIERAPPTFDNVPAPDAVEATSANGAVVTFATPTATDADGNDVDVSCAPASGSTFSLGTTAVTCSATDSFGAAASASFNVTVQDTTAPVITAIPVSITVGKKTSAGAIVNFASQLGAADLVDGAVVPSAHPASGSLFRVGSTTVTVTATDAHQNVSPPKTFRVIVRRQTPKSITPTINVSVAPSAIGEGNNATFTVFASPPSRSQPLTVNYRMNGTATPASQFYTLSGPVNQVTLPSGASAATVILHVLPNSLTSGSETATMMITSGRYNISSTKKTATATINNGP